MDSFVLLMCLGIILARITDVSLGTLHTMFVVQGRRKLAWVLGFFEILIWVVVVSKVIQNLSEPAYAVAYALGYATGNVVGITMENWLAYGEQVIRVFTRKGETIATQLRGEGFRVTTFAGEEGDGPVDETRSRDDVQYRRRRPQNSAAVATGSPGNGCERAQ